MTVSQYLQEPELEREAMRQQLARLQQQNGRLLQLVKELGSDPWVDNGVRRVCRVLLNEWENAQRMGL